MSLYKRILLFLCPVLVAGGCCQAARISGLVTDEQGHILPYSSILVKGTTRGVTANSEGRYSLELDPGVYTISCQYVGYTRAEKTVTIVATQAPLVLDFQLALQQRSMGEVVVRPGGEDPAYEIIRHAIKKRKDYEHPLDSFTCEAYIKTLVSLRKLPNRIMGLKVDPNDRREMHLDSAGKGILYLSESLTRIAFKRPDRIKLEVLSGRESGTNGYGFNFPTFINFYNNNVTVLTSRLNPRGFVSPVAETALHYYRYKYLGSFWEDGKEINTIQVIPRRRFEPLFSGTIDIMEGDWRIHGLDLRLLKESQLEILDTLEIRQIHMPIAPGVWQTKDQVVRFTFNIFGVDAVGHFLNVYSKYDPAPRFRRKFFNNVLVKYDTAVNKKDRSYWDSVRPVPLEPEESADYQVRDSLFRDSQDSAHKARDRDSLLRKQGPVKPGQLVMGFKRSDFNPAGALSYSLESLPLNLQYNTAEGVNLTVTGTVAKQYKKEGLLFSLSPHLRYGFSNRHLTAWGVLALDKHLSTREGEGFARTRQHWSIAGGKRVSQYNPENPITETMNSLYTLLAKRNYMKTYEAWFAELRSSRRFDNGLQVAAWARYEDRRPLDNSSDFSLIHYKDRVFTPNYPVEQLSAPFAPHEAFLTGIDWQYQPGQRYIEYPDRRMAIGSKYPTLLLSWQKGWKGALGSDVDFDKWNFSVRDDLNLRLKGVLRYRFGIGGFLQARSVFIQDYQHFNGNQLLFASPYLNSFQLAPYYANSTTASFYATGHLEHHFNGLLTNKVPLLRKLNWNLVAGANAFYVNRGNHYTEVFGGLENIFKVLRVDFVQAWMNGGQRQFGVRAGLGGVFGGAVRRRLQ